MSRVLNVVLVHQAAAFVTPVIEWWRKVSDPENLLIVHGGSEQAYAELEYPNKVYVADPRLRTRDHPRERQSYLGVLAAVSSWLASRDFQYVYLAEFDHLPLVPDLAVRLVERLQNEGADLLGHGLRRVDDTSWHHYLYHASDPEFAAYWRRLTRRADSRVVLSMLGTGSFWTREAFDAVAREREPFPIYLEIYLPTCAHHLGYRVRDFGDQNDHVRNLGSMKMQIEDARHDGAWTVHPVKLIDDSGQKSVCI